MDDNYYREIELAYAIAENDQASVNKLLTEPMDLNLVYTLFGQGTLLHGAVEKHSMGLVRQLLAFGCNPTIPDQHTRQPLSYAAEAGYVEIVSMLLGAQSSVNAGDSLNRTALYYGIVSGDSAVVRLLLEAGADTNISDFQGATPLLLALETAPLIIVRQLLMDGADYNHQDCYGFSPLHYAIRSDESTSLVKELLRMGAYADLEDFLSYTPLYYAIADSQVSTVKLLLKAGAHIEREDSSGVSLFTYASIWGNADVLELLLRRNPDPNRLDRMGCSPFYYYLDRSIPEEKIVQLFLEKGGVINPSMAQKLVLKGRVQRNFFLVVIAYMAGSSFANFDIFTHHQEQAAFDRLCCKTVSLFSRELKLQIPLTLSFYKRLLLSLPNALKKVEQAHAQQLEQIRALEKKFPSEILSAIYLHVVDNDFTEIYLGLSGLSTHATGHPWERIMGVYQLFNRLERLRFKYHWQPTEQAIDTFFSQVAAP